MLKIEEIKELIQIIDESHISEFSYEHDGSQINIKKAQASASMTQASVPYPSSSDENNPSAQVDVSLASSAAQADAEEQPAQVEEAMDESITEIIAPMVGTFYRRPSPENDTYVEVGDHVRDDSIVCIVEAMKLFNEIEAETTGEIVEVLVNDGELVEYGQALFKVKTT